MENSFDYLSNRPSDQEDRLAFVVRPKALHLTTVRQPELTIENANPFPLYFKVTTTNPELWRPFPSIGIISPRKIISVFILLIGEARNCKGSVKVCSSAFPFHENCFWCSSEDRGASSLKTGARDVSRSDHHCLEAFREGRCVQDVESTPQNSVTPVAGCCLKDSDASFQTAESRPRQIPSRHRPEVEEKRYAQELAFTTKSHAHPSSGCCWTDHFDRERSSASGSCKSSAGKRFVQELEVRPQHTVPLIVDVLWDGSDRSCRATESHSSSDPSYESHPQSAASKKRYLQELEIRPQRTQSSTAGSRSHQSDHSYKTTESHSRRVPLNDSTPDSASTQKSFVQELEIHPQNTLPLLTDAHWHGSNQSHKATEPHPNQTSQAVQSHPASSGKRFVQELEFSPYYNLPRGVFHSDVTLHPSSASCRRSDQERQPSGEPKKEISSATLVKYQEKVIPVLEPAEHLAGRSSVYGTAASSCDCKPAEGLSRSSAGTYRTSLTIGSLSTGRPKGGSDKSDEPASTPPAISYVFHEETDEHDARNATRIRRHRKEGTKTVRVIHDETDDDSRAASKSHRRTKLALDEVDSKLNRIFLCHKITQVLIVTLLVFVALCAVLCVRYDCHLHCKTKQQETENSFMFSWVGYYRGLNYF